MSKEHTIGKSLKGVYADKLDDDLLISNFLKSLQERGLQNVALSQCTINSTPIGNYIPSSIVCTTLQSGNASGDGYDVIFYGQTIGEYLKWDSTLGFLEVNGSLSLTESADLGNIRIAGNTISSTNLNGDINLDPNGTGSVNLPYDTKITYGPTNYIMGTTTGLNISGDEIVFNGNLTVNGTTNLNSLNVVLDDIILTLGGDTTPIATDGKDRGVEFKYYTSSAKLGFFGYDDTDGYFTYIPDATNTSDVISGAPGNVKFATGSFTDLELNNGDITNVNVISSSGDITIQPGTAGDVILNVDSGSNVIIPPNVDLLFDGESTKIYSDGSSLNIDVVGGDFNVNTNTVIDGDLTVTGNFNFSGGTTINLTVERFTVAGGASGSPSNGSNTTFVTVTGSGVATGTMPAGVTDGFFKNIAMSSIASGCSYELTFPVGTLVDPVSGTSVVKKMIFSTSGQGVQLLWDNVASVYIITQGGAEIVAI